MPNTLRYNAKVLDYKLSRALSVASGGRLTSEYRSELGKIKDDIEGKIRSSGRGGSHNEEFAKQDVRVTKSGSGRYSIQFGWINTSGHAKERGSGGRLWYQYQDAGFQLFGKSGVQYHIEGVGATMDRREKVIEAIQRVNERYVEDIARELNR